MEGSTSITLLQLSLLSLFVYAQSLLFPYPFRSHAILHTLAVGNTPESTFPNRPSLTAIFPCQPHPDLDLYLHRLSSSPTGATIPQLFHFSLCTPSFSPFSLRKIADAFKDLANSVNSHTLDDHLEIAPVSHACSLVSPLFRCLGIVFKFAEMDYVAKVDDLSEASKSILTLQKMMDKDIEENCVKRGGSHTRNLLRVKRDLDMVKVLFKQIISSEGNSLKNPASTAYAQVFAPYHGWTIRKAVSAGMYALPTKSQLLKKLNEDETTARIQMQTYVTSSALVILYIDKLFLSRELGIDW